MPLPAPASTNTQHLRARVLPRQAHPSPAAAAPASPLPTPRRARRSVTLRLAQDPSSENLGTTVWDASIVMAKFLEKVRACRTAWVVRAAFHGGRELAARQQVDLAAGFGETGARLMLSHP